MPYKASPLSSTVTGTDVSPCSTPRMSDSCSVLSIKNPVGRPSNHANPPFCRVTMGSSLDLQGRLPDHRTSHQETPIESTKTLRRFQLSGLLGQVIALIGQLPAHRWDATQPRLRPMAARSMHDHIQQLCVGGGKAAIFPCCHVDLRGSIALRVRMEEH